MQPHFCLSLVTVGSEVILPYLRCRSAVLCVLKEIAFPCLRFLLVCETGLAIVLNRVEARIKDNV